MAANDAKIRITADTAQAERALDNLDKSLKGISETSLGVNKALGTITAAAAAMGYAILKTLDSAGQLIDVSKALGISAVNLQALQHAAAQAGVSADTLSATLIKLSGNLGSALSKGTGPAIDALNRLGIPLQQIASAKPDEQFRLIANELNKMTNPAERNALAIEFFGKQGPRMLEVAKGLEAARKELDDMGLTLSTLDLAALDEAGDAVDSLKSIFESGLKKAVADIAPYIIAIVDKIKDAIKEAGGFEAVWERIKNAIRLALNIALLTAAIGSIAKMVQGAIALATAIRAAGSAMALFNTIVMRNPLMLVIGAAVALATLLGVDVVGAIEKAMGLTEGLKDANDKAAKKANEITKANEESAAAIKIGREEQEKALKALDETINKSKLNVQYQQDILKYGEQEAGIRQKVNEEVEKLNKAKVDINSKEAQALLSQYQANLRVEESLKRQISLRKEQADTAFQLILAEQSTFEQALQKRLEFQLLMEGKGAEQIKELRRQQYEEDPGIRKAAEMAQELSVQRVLDSEIGKYNSLYAMKKRHSKEIKDLNDLENSALVNGVKLTEDQIEAIRVGKEELYRSQQLERLKFDEDMANKRVDIEVDRINRVLMAERGAIAQSLSDSDKALLQRVGENERQKAIVQERINFEKKSDLEKAQFGIDQAQNMFAALGKENKKAFEASKALAVAQALMNTYQGATKALATYPFPFGLIAAAAAVAAGYAQINAIKSQQYSGRALGGPVMSGQSYIVGESGPELFTPNTTGSITRNGDLGKGGPVNVNFTIVANDTQGFDQLLTSRKGVITQIISDAMLERGQRSMV